MTFASRLAAGLALVIGILVALIVVAGGARLDGALQEHEAATLTAEARLVASQWHATVNPPDLVRAAADALGRRVTLLDRSGHVLGDSELAADVAARPMNESQEPEVEQAIRTGQGTARRDSPLRGDEELYAAVAVPAGIVRVSMPAAELDAIVARVRLDALLAGLITLVLALAVATVLARGITRPLVELRDATRALAAGDFSRRPALAAGGEVGDLSMAVHRMAEQLDQRLRALQAEEALLGAAIESLHEGVVAVDARRQVVRVNDSGRRLLRLERPVPFSTDFLPREAALRELLATALGGRAAGPAEIAVDGRTLAVTARPLTSGGAVLAFYDLTATRRLEAVRRDFVANVSHELKTPLTVIGGFAETLVSDDLPDAQRAQFAESIRANAERMRRIVDDLLDLSRIESGGWRPNPAVLQAGALAEEVLAGARRGRGAAGIQLDTSIDPAASTVYADPTAIRQVLANLVDNAVRYTPAGGTVTVFTLRDAAGTWMGVRDTGRGIPPEHLPRIFERFYRVDPARSREAGGTGLGLSIVRHLVEAHGGRVEAQSTPGRGTTIRALFPGPAVTPS